MTETKKEITVTATDEQNNPFKAEVITEKVTDDVLDVSEQTTNEIVTKDNLETDLVTLNFENSLVETTIFQEVLAEIPNHVKRANALLEDYRKDPETFLDNVNDTEVEALIKDLDTVNKFTGKVTKTRTAIKKHMDQLRDKLLTALDARLEDAQFNALSQIHNDTRQLRKDILNDRLARRWEELRPTFDANVKRYPLLRKYAKTLCDFDYFKQLYPDMLSGAKSRKVRDKDHTVINEKLYEWSVGLELLHQNKWGLSDQDMLRIATMYEKNPTIQFVEQEAIALKTQEINRLKAEEEAKRRRAEEEQKRKEEAERRAKEIAEAQERERLARLARDEEAAKRAQAEQALLEKRAEEAKRKQAIQEAERQEKLKNFDTFKTQHDKNFVEAYPIYTEYLFKNPALHDIHKSDRIKAMAIFELMEMARDQNSILLRETNLEPHRVMNLIRYISSLS